MGGIVPDYLFRFGYSREQIDSCREDIENSNLVVLRAFSLLFVAVYAFLTLTADDAYRLLYLGGLVFAAIVTALSFTVAAKSRMTQQILLTISLLFCFAITAVMGLLLSPNSMAVSFVVLLAALPVLTIIQPLLGAGIVLISGATFIAFAFQIKTPDIALNDTINITVFGLWGIVAFYAFARIRIQSMLDRILAKKANDRSNDILAGLPSGIAVLKREGDFWRFSYANPTLLSMLHYREFDLRKAMEMDSIPGLDPEQTHAVFERFNALNTEQVDFEIDDLKVTTSDNCTLWLNLSVHYDSAETCYLLLTDVSEMHQLKKEQNRAQDRLAISLKESALGIWEYNLDEHRCVLLSKNDKYGAISLLEDYPNCLKTEGYIDDEGLELFEEATRRIRAGEKGMLFEARLQEKDGSYTWYQFDFHTEKEQNDAGKPAAILFTRNINERKSIEQKYLEQVYYMDALYSKNLVASRFDLDDDKVISLHGSDSVKAYLGDAVTATELIERIINTLPATSKRTELSDYVSIDALRTAYAEGRTHFTIDHFDKRLNLWIRSTITLTMNPFTNHVETLMTGEDITLMKLEQITVTAVAMKTHDFLGIINTTTGEFFYLLGKNGNYERASIDDYRTASEEFIRMFDESFASPEERQNTQRNILLDNVMRELDRSTDGSYEFSIHLNGSESDEKLTYRMTFSFVENDYTQILVAGMDATSIVAHEREQQEVLGEALTAAESANHAKSAFLSRMSHEIRTPMNAIIGITELATGELDDKQALSNDLAKISSSAGYLLSLINDILDMSRIESGRMTLAKDPLEFDDFIELINDVIATQALDKNITYTTEIDASLHRRFIGDRVKLQQVLVNILGNAVKFTNPGGTITLSAKELETTDTGMRIRFLISDTGCGISPEFREHLFEPFSREDTATTSTRNGTGLGLAISRNIVTLMNGTIAVESEQGVGSTFTVEVELPFGEGAGDLAVKKEKPFDASCVDLSGIHILMAEDHPINQEVARRLLEMKGAAVTIADNGQIALDIFRSAEEDTFNLILMDIQMPVLDGYGATKAIRACTQPDGSTIPIVAMTANAFDEDRQATRAAGMNAHLSKPVDADDLFATILSFCKPE